MSSIFLLFINSANFLLKPITNLPVLTAGRFPSGLGHAHKVLVALAWQTVSAEIQCGLNTNIAFPSQLKTVCPTYSKLLDPCLTCIIVDQ